MNRPDGSPTAVPKFAQPQLAVLWRQGSDASKYMKGQRSFSCPRPTLSFVALAVIAISIASAARAEGPSRAFSAKPRIKYRDDGSALYWYIDHQRRNGKQGVLVIAQGSGCQSVALNSNVARAKSLLSDFVVLTVEKYGVRPEDDPVDQSNCSPTFYAHHTVSQRADDYMQVLSELKKQSWWNGQLALFGGSEGGAVVAELAPQTSANAVVIFSTGTGISLREAFKQVVPPPIAAGAEAEFAKIRADPLSSKVWGGNSYRWWADIMDRVLVDDLLRAREPILLVQGELDRNAPVSAGRAARDAFSRAGRCNLTYWEFKGYDHQMIDVWGKSHSPEVLNRISAWLRARLADPDPCPTTK